MGFKVPWVKVWLDPQTSLPVQVHAAPVENGPQAWTLSDFHWNEAFDKSLVQVAVPKGYTLEPAEPKLTDQPPMRSEVAAQAAAEGGRVIPLDEIPKTLDMLAERSEANFEKITTWTGTYERVEKSAR